MKAKAESKFYEYEELANRIREALMHLGNVEEKKMFRGITFMVDGKMCVGAAGKELMCRLDPADHEKEVEKRGCREMILRDRVMRGYIFVSEEGYSKKKDFDYWIKASLEFNPRAKSSKK